MASGSEARTRAIVGERAGHACELQIPEVCLGLATNISHRCARSQGGEWTPSNCLHACGSGTTGCHGWVERNWTAAHRLGLRLSNTQPPGSSPAYIRAQTGMGWFLLHADGTLTDVTYEQEHPCYV